jgi:hypothetical protein
VDAELFVMGGVDWAIGDGLIELTGFGLSLEHPTVNEQAIRSAAKISGLVAGVERNRLIRVMLSPPAAEQR